jgi:hypothetical protein
MKRFVLWGTGFVVLFGLNTLIEVVFLPLWGLDSTIENDIYFKSWWVIVGVWLLFGVRFLGYVMANNSDDTRRGRTGHTRNHP